MKCPQSVSQFGDLVERFTTGIDGVELGHGERQAASSRFAAFLACSGRDEYHRRPRAKTQWLVK